MSVAPYVVDEYVRWSDVDFAGIICYGAYLRFFELAEMELFRAAGVPYAQLFERFDLWLPRAQIHAEFHHPAKLDDRLRVAAYVSRLGTSSVTINFEVQHVGTGRLGAEGHQVLVCVDREALRPKPLPEELAALLTRFRLSREAARTALGLPLAGR